VILKRREARGPRWKNDAAEVRTAASVTPGGGATMRAYAATHLAPGKAAERVIAHFALERQQR